MADIMAIAPLAFFTLLGLGCALLIGFSLAELGRFFETWLPANATIDSDRPVHTSRSAVPRAS